MKTFYVTLAVFATMLGIIIWNACYVDRTAEELNALLDALPPCEQSAQSTETLRAYWDKHRDIIALSTSFDDVIALDNCIIEMQTAAQEGEGGEYEKNKALAYAAIARIRRIERLSIDSIF